MTLPLQCCLLPDAILIWQISQRYRAQLAYGQPGLTRRQVVNWCLNAGVGSAIPFAIQVSLPRSYSRCDKTPSQHARGETDRRCEDKCAAGVFGDATVNEARYRRALIKITKHLPLLVHGQAIYAANSTRPAGAPLRRGSECEICGPDFYDRRG